jgi:hypothetical protein
MDPPVDELGYWTATPLGPPPPSSLRATALDLIGDAATDAHAGTDAALDATAPISSWTFTSTTPFDLNVAGTNHTGFLVGTAPAMTLLWCDDTTAVGTGTLTSCFETPAE